MRGDGAGSKLEFVLSRNWLLYTIPNLLSSEIVVEMIFIWFTWCVWERDLPGHGKEIRNCRYITYSSASNGRILSRMSSKKHSLEFEPFAGFRFFCRAEDLQSDYWIVASTFGVCFWRQIWFLTANLPLGPSQRKHLLRPNSKRASVNLWMF